jgi:hypothetical protein
MASSSNDGSSEASFLHRTHAMVAQAQTAAAQGANLHPFPGVEEEGAPNPETNTQGVSHDPTGWFDSVAKVRSRIFIVRAFGCIAQGWLTSACIFNISSCRSLFCLKLSSYVILPFINLWYGVYILYLCAMNDVVY